MVEKWWESGNEGWIRMLRGLGPGKWSSGVMKMVGFVQGWRKQCCTKNVEIRVSWESMASGGKKSWVRE